MQMKTLPADSVTIANKNIHLWSPLISSSKGLGSTWCIHPSTGNKGSLQLADGLHQTNSFFTCLHMQDKQVYTLKEAMCCTSVIAVLNLKQHYVTILP